MKFNIKIFGAIIASIITLSIAYYFVVALPQYIQNKIDLQQQEFNAEQKEKEREAEAERSRKVLLNLCLMDARDQYWSYVKLNGTDLGDGTYRAYPSVWNEAEKRQKSAEDTCKLKYGK